ncbi:hypothetical protein L596_025976 [Steinernema carpocapsae]|uniref:Uncharacterized protein n=1 Tax=Steinernema carpocapsae TaxID=34508 RepID=A0A4U5M9B8_STECR|nr:hypothetical protein L596_025976 [Steinernema carpocapsae]
MIGQTLYVGYDFGQFGQGCAMEDGFLPISCSDDLVDVCPHHSQWIFYTVRRTEIAPPTQELCLYSLNAVITLEMT